MLILTSEKKVSTSSHVEKRVGKNVHPELKDNAFD